MEKESITIAELEDKIEDKKKELEKTIAAQNYLLAVSDVHRKLQLILFDYLDNYIAITEPEKILLVSAINKMKLLEDDFLVALKE